MPRTHRSARDSDLASIFLGVVAAIAAIVLFFLFTTVGCAGPREERPRSMISTRSLSALPPIRELRRITQGLATLDAILCESWDSRYYSFNGGWNVERGEAMASMRNGSGDEWFLLFTKAGAVLKGFAHEKSAMSPVAGNKSLTPVLQRGHQLYPGLLTGFPDDLSTFLD